MKNRSIRFVYAILALVLASLACSMGASAEPTETPEPTATNTPLPSPTKTTRPTATPEPTETPFPTPAGIGDPVLGDDIEIIVVDAYDRDRIYPGGELVYSPNPGYMIIDMGVQLKNLNPGQTVSIPWNRVYILEDNGDSWYPIWGNIKEVDSGETYDPFSIGIKSEQLEGSEKISFSGDAYMRLIYLIRDSNTQVLFGIGNSGQVELTLKK